MRIIPMCFSSILQVPRCRFHTLANFWPESFHSLPNKCGSNSTFRLHSAKLDGLEGGYSRRWIRRPVSTKTEGTNKITQNKNKLTSASHGVLEETVSTSTLNITKTENIEYRNIPYFDIRREILENNDLAKLVTVIVFDLETTGFSRTEDRIVEIALRDLHGGENSTFQTLVNPGRSVPNTIVHGISKCMVENPNVPRMKEVAPILLQYVKSRHKPGGYALLVAHNGRAFDVPFLITELNRCGVELPSNWLFLDSLPLARKWIKTKGVKSRTSLQGLREHLGIKLEGPAHRAMSDVRVLIIIFQKMTFDLKATVASLVADSFTASEKKNEMKESDVKKKKKN
ncbi:exonuclease DPD1, chloroplastic/mitochondrial [Mercurialis annua]|uniref:exonuclease DPD1, chloroplastic/mitochondrial n=1 Tax=Mercurialis annua TaxID=3986 RepID=UPI00215E0DAA|nr:exonuclease DPD1, chloroplastic/mitochondrial [Mercurialis annua]XP_050225532.1 exonuclease DPD1, chloroplastic/mitochondrial [Mercurialis annua]